MSGAVTRGGLVVAMVITMASAAFASAGHDHGPARQTIVLAPRAETRIGNQEAVLTYVDGKVVVFLHRYADGVPLTGAELEMTADFLPSTLEEIAAGVYRSEAIGLAGGQNEIELTYTIDGQSRSAKVPLVLPSTANAAPLDISMPSGAISGAALALIALVIFAGVNVLLVGRSRRAP